MAQYQGHRSWNAWNVALWINNDHGLYSRALDLVKRYGKKHAARMLHAELAGQKTPDGARYNVTCIAEALRDIVE